MSQKITVLWPSEIIMPLPQDWVLQNRIIENAGLIFDEEGERVESIPQEALPKTHWCVPYASLLRLFKDIADKLRHAEIAEINFAFFDKSFLAPGVESNIIDKILRQVMPNELPAAFTSTYWASNANDTPLITRVKKAYYDKCKKQGIEDLITQCMQERLQDKETLYNYFVPFFDINQNDADRRNFDNLLLLNREKTSKAVLQDVLLSWRLRVSPEAMIAALKARFGSESVIIFSPNNQLVLSQHRDLDFGDDVHIIHMPTYADALKDFRQGRAVRSEVFADFYGYEKLMQPFADALVQFAHPLILIASYLSIVKQTPKEERSRRYSAVAHLLMSTLNKHSVCITHLSENCGNGLNNALKNITRGLKDADQSIALHPLQFSSFLEKLFFKFTMNYHGKIFKKDMRFYEQPLISLLPDQLIEIFKKVNDCYGADHEILFNCFLAWLSANIQRRCQGVQEGNAQTYANNFGQMAVSYIEKNEEKDRAATAIEALIKALREQITAYEKGLRDNSPPRQEQVDEYDAAYASREGTASVTDTGGEESNEVPFVTPIKKQSSSRTVRFANAGAGGRSSRASSIGSQTLRIDYDYLQLQSNLSEEEQGKVRVYSYDNLPSNTNIMAYLSQRLRVTTIESSTPLYPLFRSDRDNPNRWLLIALIEDKTIGRDYYRLNPITHKLELNLPLQDNPIMIVDGILPVDEDEGQGQKIKLKIMLLHPELVYLGKPEGNGLRQLGGWNAMSSDDFNENTKYKKVMKSLLKYLESPSVEQDSITAHNLIELCTILRNCNIDPREISEVQMQNFSQSEASRLYMLQAVVRELDRIEKQDGAFELQFSAKGGAIATLNKRYKMVLAVISLFMDVASVATCAYLFEKNPYVKISEGDIFFYLTKNNTNIIALSIYAIPIGFANIMLKAILDKVISLYGEYSKNACMKGAEDEEAFALALRVSQRADKPLAALSNAVLEVVPRSELSKSRKLQDRIGDVHGNAEKFSAVLTESDSLSPSILKILRDGTFTSVEAIVGNMRNTNAAETSYLNAISLQSKIAMYIGLGSMLAAIVVATIFATRFYSAIESSAEIPLLNVNTDELQKAWQKVSSGFMDDAAKLSHLTLDSMNVLGLAILAFSIFITTSFCENLAFLSLEFFNWCKAPAKPQPAEPSQRCNWINMSSLTFFGGRSRQGTTNHSVNTAGEGDALLDAEEGRHNTALPRSLSYGAATDG